MKNKIIKIIKISVSLVLIFISLILMCLGLIFNTKTYNSNISVDKKLQTLSFNTENIEVLVLADIQVINTFDTTKAFPVVKNLVKKTTPDLIILLGDNVDNSSSYNVVKSLIDLFDGFKIPWAPVFGNHDLNSDVSEKQMCQMFEKSKYCLFKTGEIENKYGNYYYDLYSENNLIQRLIFMDASQDFTQKQINWYSQTIINLEQKNNNAKSMMFFHIPLFETKWAYEYYLNNPQSGSGEHREQICNQSDNDMYETIVNHDNTKALFYGHDHINNTIINYNDITFAYGLKSAPTSYYDNDLIGANLININKNGSFLIERIYFS